TGITANGERQLEPPLQGEFTSVVSKMWDHSFRAVYELDILRREKSRLPSVGVMGNRWPNHGKKQFGG
ncbi:MAG: hypothetical protein ACREBQ_06990, partial [Nitrososphaerales archaeon]